MTDKTNIIVKTFENEEFGSVRTVEEEGKFLFCGSDVSKALGYLDTTQAIRKNCKNDGVSIRQVTDRLGRTQNAKFITEGNLYRLISHSKLPSAEKFESWIFDEVLPSIRKTGGYVSNNYDNQIILSSIQSLHTENKLIQINLSETINKISRLESLLTFLLPPTKHSQWKSEMSRKIRNIADTLGIDETEIKGIYGSIYNKMRNDYGLDVNNYIADYLLNHKEVSNPPAIDIVDSYPELKELFENIVDNYIQLET